MQIMRNQKKQKQAGRKIIAPPTHPTLATARVKARPPAGRAGLPRRLRRRGGWVGGREKSTTCSFLEIKKQIKN